MCGIAGILKFSNPPISLHDIKGMTDALKHRGPDGEGHYLESDGSLALGHRRLSILDLTDNGKQPMELWDTNRYVIVFNGEIYNYLELRAKLEGFGYTFKTETDTEVLLRLFSHMKLDCLDEVDGMFAFAIWDKEERQLYCARDRFGEKPFYYFSDKQRFIWASEMKGLFSAGVERSVNHFRLSGYITDGRIDTSIGETFYENICELLPGNWLIISQDKAELKHKSYWKLEIREEALDLSIDQAVSSFQELFDTSIKRRLRSDVPVGSSLSGGLDSSSIVSTIDRFKTDVQVQKTFSARFPGYNKDEGEFIDLMNGTVSSQAFSTQPDGEKLLDHLDHLFYHQEEPFQHVSIFAQYEVMKLAKEEQVTVLLDGQGADEYLAGYHSYIKIYLKQLYLSNKKEYASLKSASESLLGKDFGFTTNQKIAYQFPQLLSIKKALSRKKKDFGGELKEEYSNAYTCVMERKPLNSLKEALNNSLTFNGLPTLLRYADRNSMAHSREVRLPFLNHKLVEFVLSLSEEMLIKDGWTKFLLRKSMESRLPREITWRKDKIGYEPPQAKWMENKKMKELLKEAIDSLGSENILNRPDSNHSWRYIMAYKALQGV